MNDGAELRATIQMKMHTKATLSVKSGIAVTHLQAAALFARLCWAEEKNPTSVTDRVGQRSFAIGSVVCAAAFLEAAVNELYLAAIDRDQQVFQNVDKTISELLAKFWPEVRSKSALLKYQTALILARVGSLDEGQRPFQDAASLFALRNALMHFKPEWDTELDEHFRLEQRLKGKFAESPFAAHGDAFFPKRCLGHGCAAWAVETAKVFYDVVMKQAGFWARDFTDSQLYGTMQG